MLVSMMSRRVLMQAREHASKMNFPRAYACVSSKMHENESIFTRFEIDMCVRPRAALPSS